MSHANVNLDSLLADVHRPSPPRPSPPVAGLPGLDITIVPGSRAFFPAVGGLTEGYTVSIETITPEMAKVYLEEMGHNRRPKGKNQTTISTALVNGRYILNGQPIIFGQSGKLLDGQHRMMCCVATGVPFMTFVVRGVPDIYYGRIDQGSPKTLADKLERLGKPHAPPLPPRDRARDGCSPQGGSSLGSVEDRPEYRRPGPAGQDAAEYTPPSTAPREATGQDGGCG